MRKFFSVVLLACTSLLASCSSKPEDPTPDATRRSYVEQTRYAPVKAGEPFTLDNCNVQVYKVFSQSGGVLGGDVFTLATAQCESAKITAVNEGCGKSCVNNNIRVEPVAAPAGNEQAAEVAEMQKKLAQAQAEAKRKAELQEKLRQLQMETDKVSAELEKSK